jgi:hypothetical protein
MMSCVVQVMAFLTCAAWTKASGSAGVLVGSER